MSLTDLLTGRREGRTALSSPLPPKVESQLLSLAHALATHPRKPRSIALVGCGRGVGTSTCTVNLGRTLAGHHARTTLVDANLHDPSLHSLCGVEPSHGLADLVAGEVSPDLAPKPTAIPNLFVIPSGTPGTANGDLVRTLCVLRSHVLHRVAPDECVLVDCPPVHVYEEAATIAAACDGTILVVEGSHTLRQAAVAAKALIERANGTVLGVVMNKRKFYVPGFIYDRI